MNKMKGLWADFKKFISRGNIVDMAVGVIIGGAFSAIVTALTNKIIKPFIDWIVKLATGGTSLGLYTFMNKVMMNVPEIDSATGEATGKIIQTIDFANSIYIDWGAFIMAIIDFLLIAIVLFIIVKVIAGLQKTREEFNNADKKEVNKKAKAIAKEKGVSKKEALEIVKADIEAQKAAEEAAAAAKAAEEAANNPTSEQLLKEIRDLLAAQNKDKKAE